jgi:hypothetical protein
MLSHPEERDDGRQTGRNSGEQDVDEIKLVANRFRNSGSEQAKTPDRHNPKRNS